MNEQITMWTIIIYGILTIIICLIPVYAVYLIIKGLEKADYKIRQCIKHKCKNCKQKFRKSELATVDLNKELCPNCLKEEFLKGLEKYKHRAIVTYPLKPTKEVVSYSYQFYGVEEMTGREFTQEFSNGIRGFFPPENSECKDCGKPARFNWCSSKIYFDNPYSERIDTSGFFEQQYLCEKCVTNKLFEKIKNESIKIDELDTPIYIKEDGIYITFEI